MKSAHKKLIIMIQKEVCEKLNIPLHRVDFVKNIGIMYLLTF